MEYEIKKYVSISDNDFINTTNLLNVNYKGGLIFNETSIGNISKKSKLLIYLNEIIAENKIKEKDYEIYFQRNKEWYNKFIFYKKK